MEYIGKLYGHVAGRYFDTGKTSDDFDNATKDIIDFGMWLTGSDRKTTELMYKDFKEFPSYVEWCKKERLPKDPISRAVYNNDMRRKQKLIK